MLVTGLGYQTWSVHSKLGHCCGCYLTAERRLGLDHYCGFFLTTGTVSEVRQGADPLFCISYIFIENL